MKNILNYLLHRKTHEHFFKFAIVGAVSFLVDFSLLLVLVEFFFVQKFVAISIAYVAGVVTHFNLNKFWNFKNHEQQYHKQLVAYIVGIVLYYIISLAVIQLFIANNGNYALGKVAATAVLAVLNFFYQRHITFGHGVYAMVNRLLKK